MSARFVAALLAMGKVADELTDVMAAVIIGPPSRAVARRDFELPGQVALERGDVARIIGERDAKPANVRHGLVPCATCLTDQAPRDGHMAVHFASREAIRPCAGSWPAKVVRR